MSNLYQVEVAESREMMNFPDQKIRLVLQVRKIIEFSTKLINRHLSSIWMSVFFMKNC